LYLRISGIIAAVALAALADAPAKLSRDDAQKLKSPMAYSKKSIDRGRATFLQNCTSCHGENGKAEGSLIADATDLTTPTLYKSGTTEGEIFRSIRDGAGGLGKADRAGDVDPFRHQPGPVHSNESGALALDVRGNQHVH